MARTYRLAEIRRVAYDIEEEIRLLLRTDDPFAQSTAETLSFDGDARAAYALVDGEQVADISISLLSAGCRRSLSRIQER